MKKHILVGIAAGLLVFEFLIVIFTKSDLKNTIRSLISLSEKVDSNEKYLSEIRAEAQVELANIKMMMQAEDPIPQTWTTNLAKIGFIWGNRGEAPRGISWQGDDGKQRTIIFTPEQRQTP
jgi:hypothetical protein